MAKHRAATSVSPSLSSLPRSSKSTLLTVDQAAERLNVSSAYVRRRLIFEKRIPYVKIGRHVRIESQVVEGLIEAGRIVPELVEMSSRRPQRTIEEIREEELARWRTSESTR